MEPRRIELPETARQCWPKAVELVGELMRECATLEHEQWYLGGGTALAADWKHRTSTDIDILIAPGLSMDGLGPEANARLERRIATQGGERLRTPDQKLSVDYGPDGRVDIFSSGRQLSGHEEAIEIDGTLAARLSDAQIFACTPRRHDRSTRAGQQNARPPRRAAGHWSSGYGLMMRCLIRQPSGVLTKTSS